MKIVEITKFRLISDVEDRDFMKVAKDTQDIVESFPGYLSRTLCKKDDGTWIDILYWKSKEDAQSAAKSAMESEALKPFMEMIDPNSVEMNFLEERINWKK